MPGQVVMGCVRKLAKLEPGSELVSSIARKVKRNPFFF